MCTILWKILLYLSVAPEALAHSLKGRVLRQAVISASRPKQSYPVTLVEFSYVRDWAKYINYIQEYYKYFYRLDLWIKMVDSAHIHLLWGNTPASKNVFWRNHNSRKSHGVLISINHAFSCSNYLSKYNFQDFNLLNNHANKMACQEYLLEKELYPPIQNYIPRILEMSYMNSVTTMKLLYVQILGSAKAHENSFIKLLE